MARTADRRRLALVATPLLAAGALALVIAVGDVPLRSHRAPDSGHSRAAVALRDDVIPFQKWGTELFTVPHLRSAYDQVYYLTQRTPGDQHQALVDDLTRALRDHDEVDLFLLAHGNRFIDWAREVPAELRHKLRLVYNTGCGNAYQGQEWLELGAQAYVGHASPHSVSPAFYFFFLRRWVRGWSLAEAVEAANRAAHRRMVWFGMDQAWADPRAVLVGRADLWVGGGGDAGAGGEGEGAP